MIEYTNQNPTKDIVKIKVLGIGGGGNNAVNQMIKNKIQGAEYYLINTERKVLDRANTNNCKTLQIGKEISRGLGAGANPEIGEKSAIESTKEIELILEGTDLLFLTAGMGGGTGTGATPVIAEIARKMGILTVAVVTTPFIFEGKLRKERAELGIKKLMPKVNSLIVISNNKLLKNTENNISMLNAFELTDDILRQAIESITDLVHSVGEINIDFADIRTILSYEGFAYMGIGEAEGENKIQDATELALSNPLTINKINGAKGVIFNIKGGEDIGLEDINRSAEIISNKIDPDANVIFGTVIDKNLADKVVVTIVATNIDESEKNE